MALWSIPFQSFKNYMYSPKLVGAREVWGRRDKTFVIPFRDVLYAWGQCLFANDGNLDSIEVVIGMIIVVGARKVLLNFLRWPCRKSVAYTLVGGPVAGFTICCQVWLRVTYKEIELELDWSEGKISISLPQLIFEA